MASASNLSPILVHESAAYSPNFTNEDAVNNSINDIREVVIIDEVNEKEIQPKTLQHEALKSSASNQTGNVFEPEKPKTALEEKIFNYINSSGQSDLKSKIHLLSK